MTGDCDKEENGKRKVTPSFHQRFSIDVPMEKAQQSFINRILNELDDSFPQLEDWGEDSYDYNHWTGINSYVAGKLGKRYQKYSFIEYAGTNDFFEFLKALEALYEALDQLYMDHRPRMLGRIVKAAIAASEIDLGITWREGVFYPSGAKLLDEELVDKSLDWLSDPKYRDIHAPFDKGLRHLMEAVKYPDGLVDTIRDMYEALEKMARITTGNNKNLLGNIDDFVNMLGLDTHYRRMLKEHIGYAHKFRHAVAEGRERTPPSYEEVEAFVYTTGLFIRLAIQRLS